MDFSPTSTLYIVPSTSFRKMACKNLQYKSEYNRYGEKTRLM